jgi:hypothetical protein
LKLDNVVCNKRRRRRQRRTSGFARNSLLWVQHLTNNARIALKVARSKHLLLHLQLRLALLPSHPFLNPLGDQSSME